MNKFMPINFTNLRKQKSSLKGTNYQKNQTQAEIKTLNSLTRMPVLKIEFQFKTFPKRKYYQIKSRKKKTNHD